MKKIVLTFLSIVFLSFSSFSQQKEFEKLFKVDYSFLGLGIAYEIPLAKKWTVDLSTGIGGGYRVNNGFTAEWVLNSSPSVYLKSEFKYYINREKRFKKGKNNDNNAGNYWAFQTKFATERISETYRNIPLNNVLLNEIHWGIQRSLSENWLFNTHFGIGYARDFTFNSGTLYPAIGLKFSYIIF